MIRVFCDMDGVLADFDTGYWELTGTRLPKVNSVNDVKDMVDWDWVRRSELFRNLPPMSDMHQLWEGIKGYRPIILTGVSKTASNSFPMKQAWIHDHLGPGIPVIGCQSKDKSLYCETGDVMIDDWNKYRHYWWGKEGFWITHTSAQSSIDQLNQYMIPWAGRGWV